MGGVKLTGFVAFAVIGGAVLGAGAGCAAGVGDALAETVLGCGSPGIQRRYHAAPKAASKAAAENRVMSRGLAARLPPAASFDFVARLIRITGFGV